jgi:hypothetical protein
VVITTAQAVLLLAKQRKSHPTRNQLPIGEVTFRLLSINNINNAQTYAVWEADISAYAGQTGELLFTCADYNAGMLDNIQFSTSSVPEPSICGLFGLGILLFGSSQNMIIKNFHFPARKIFLAFLAFLAVNLAA